jgi:hypothetical protein
METENDKLTKSERNYISRNRTKDLQNALNDLLMLTFSYGLEYLELISKQKPDQLSKEFTNAFQPFEWTKMVIDILAEGRRAIFQGLELRLYAMKEQDFYCCLSPETQEKLKLQGVWYEPRLPAHQSIESCQESKL